MLNLADIWRTRYMFNTISQCSTRVAFLACSSAQPKVTVHRKHFQVLQQVTASAGRERGSDSVAPPLWARFCQGYTNGSHSFRFYGRFSRKLSLPLHMAKNKGKKTTPNSRVLTPQCLEQSLIQLVSPLGIPDQEEALPVSREQEDLRHRPFLTLRCPLRHQLTQHAIWVSRYVHWGHINHPPNPNLPHPLFLRLSPSRIDSSATIISFSNSRLTKPLTPAHSNGCVCIALRKPHI